jgi:glycine dehydrogenase
VRTRAIPVGIDVVVADPDDFDFTDAFGVLLQYPSTTGEIRDFGGSRRHALPRRN